MATQEYLTESGYPFAPYYLLELGIKKWIKKFEEVKKEIEKTKEKINNSDFDEEQKKELLRELEGITKKDYYSTTNDNKTPLHYWGWLFVVVGWIF